LELYRVCPYRLGNVTAVERLVLFALKLILTVSLFDKIFTVCAKCLGYSSYVEYLVCDVTVSILKLKYIVHAVLITSLSV